MPAEVDAKHTLWRVVRSDERIAAAVRPEADNDAFDRDGVRTRHEAAPLIALPIRHCGAAACARKHTSFKYI